MIVTRFSYWNCLFWGYLRLNHLIFWGNLRFRNVGDCGEMWGIVGWQGDIFDFGMWAIWSVRTAGCANFHKFWHFQKFFNFNIFYDIFFFLLKIVNLTNYHKKQYFPYTLQNFPMCVGNTLLQNPTVFLTDC